ncbi:hypothetical protein OIU78_024592 [Salix suchowensis]|nr:hypothetical protein OIU78_024592 [Salix suchowensis]
METQPVTQPTGYPSNPFMHYIPDSRHSGGPVQQMPVYYVPGTIPPGNVPVHPVQIRPPYAQEYPVPTEQMSIGYHQAVPGMNQVYSGVAMRPVAKIGAGYSGMVIQGGGDLKRTASDIHPGRVSPYS